MNDFIPEKTEFQIKSKITILSQMSVGLTLGANLLLN